MIAEAFAAMFPDAEKTANGWMVVCPAHGDTEGSLHVSPGGDGRTLLKCMGGCDTIDVVNAMGLGLKDLFADEPARGHGSVERAFERMSKPKKKPRAPLGEPTEVYDYTDEDGNLLYQALRYEPKTFRQRRPDASKPGGWNWSMKGQRLVLYRLPEVLAAVKRGETVYIVEGEKDANRGADIGITATTSVAGAGKWSDHIGVCLGGAKVVVLPDVDSDTRDGKPHRKGQLHARDVVRSLEGVADSVMVYELPCKDLSDWVEETGCGKEDLEHLIESDAVSGAEYAKAMDAWEEAVKGAAKQPEIKLAQEIVLDTGDGFKNNDQTDIGAADRLIERHGDDMRYCSMLKRWYIWSGFVWEEDSTMAAVEMSKTVARENAREQSRFGKKEASKALGMQQASKVKGALEMAAADKAVAVLPDEFDRHPDFLAAPNGTINLRTGELVDPDRSMMLTQMVPTEYKREAGCPTFMAFLDSTMQGNQDMIEFLQIWLGYCITGQTREQALVVAHGEGANGKGTLFDTVSDVIGPLAAEAPQGLLTAKRSDSHPTELMTVRGRRFVTASEVPEDSTWDEARLKWLTGEDKIKARGMRQDFVEWKPTHKLTVYLNNKPRVRDSSDGFWRRMKFVPFNGSFKPGTPQHDPLLREKLALEHAGILAWLVRGSVRWYDSGLTNPEQVQAATNEYREDEDRFGAWMADYRLDATLDPLQKATSMHKAYQAWCERNNERPISQRAFGLALSRAGFEKKKKSDGNYYVLPEWSMELNGAYSRSFPCEKPEDTHGDTTHAYRKEPSSPSISSILHSGENEAEAENGQKTATKEEPKQSRFDDDDDMPF